MAPTNCNKACRFCLSIMALVIFPNVRGRQKEAAVRMETDWIRMELNSNNTFLPHIYSNTNTYLNVLEYEYKTDVSNSKTHSDIYSLWKTTFTNCDNF
jgi:hypothetical protein